MPTLRHSNIWDSDYVQYSVGYNSFVTPISATIITACANAVGWGRVTILQGGLSNSVAASAATHAGLDVVDIRTRGHSKAQVWALSSALLRSGFVPFIRGYINDGFDPHIHAVRFPATHAHWSAQQQVTRYRLYRENGLANRRAYYGPSTKLDKWSNSPYNPKNKKPGIVRMVVQVDGLMGLNVDRKDRGIRRPKGYVIRGTRVKRWGRWNLVTSKGTYYAITPKFKSKTRYLEYKK